MAVETNGVSKVDAFRQKLNELERAKREADRFRQEAIAELLQRRKEITRELRQLGYEGPSEDTQTVSDGPSVGVLDRMTAEPGPRMRRRRPNPETAERRCDLCNVVGHDMRAHRGQVEKRAFSEDEMRERNLM
jgi:hypothetical protein